MDPAPDAGRREAVLARAFLLYKRGQLDAALKLLAWLPRDADVDDLRGRIAAEKSREKTVQDRLRGLRYELHLDSGFRRATAYAGALVAALYGAYECAGATPYAVQHGLGAEITSRVLVGGRFNRHWEDYTRPIYYDLLYGAAFMLVGVAVGFLVFRVARGAAEWEGLDAVDLGGGPGGGVHI